MNPSFFGSYQSYHTVSKFFPTFICQFKYKLYFNRLLYFCLILEVFFTVSLESTRVACIVQRADVEVVACRWCCLVLCCSRAGPLKETKAIESNETMRKTGLLA